MFESDQPHDPKALRWGRLIWITAVFGVIAFIAYSWPKPWVVYTLPSGNRVSHVILGQFVVEEDAILRLRYETQLPLNDTIALRREAMELWPSLRLQLAPGPYKLASFYPETAPTGLCFRHQGLCRYRGFGFLLRKNQDGRWYFDDTDELLP